MLTWHHNKNKPPGGTQIDWSHPLARGLEIAWNYTGESTTKSVRDVCNNGWGPFTFANAASLVGGTFGSLAPYSSGSTIASVSTGSKVVANAYSFLFWFKGDVVPSAAYIGQPFAFGNNTGGGVGSFSWSHSTAGFRQAVAHRNAALTYVAAKLISTLSANQWYCIVGTFDGATVRAYLNGKSEASAAAAGTVAYTADTAEVQRAAFAEPGVVDHVLFWRGRCLGETEIAQLYNSPFMLLKKTNYEME